MPRLAESIERILLQLAKGVYHDEPVIWLWGSHGIGKTYWLREINHLAANKHNLEVLRVDFPAFSAHEEDYITAHAQLHDVLTRIVDGQELTSRKNMVLLIDSAPGSDRQTASIQTLFDDLSRLTRPPYKGHVVAFLTSYWPLRTNPRLGASFADLRGQIRFQPIPPCDRMGTERQLRAMKTTSSVQEMHAALHLHIHYLTFGLPLGNEFVAEQLPVLGVNNEHDLCMREPELVNLLMQKLRSTLIERAVVSEELYEHIRTMAIYRYFDETMFPTIDIGKMRLIIETMQATGIVRYEKMTNSNEVVTPLRRLIVRHWSVTDRPGFFEHCEQALQAYKMRVNSVIMGDEVAPNEAKAALIRSELILLARIYRYYDSPDEKIRDLLHEHCAQRLNAFYTSPESLDIFRRLATQMRDDEELFCFRDDLAIDAETFTEQHTKARLAITINPQQDISASWQVSSEPPIRESSEYTGETDWMIQQVTVVALDGEETHWLEGISNHIRDYLIPEPIAQAVQESGNALEIQVAGPPIPYELMRSGESFLCLTHNVGRIITHPRRANVSERTGKEQTPPDARIANRRFMSIGTGSKPEGPAALMIALGRSDSPQADALEEEISKIWSAFKARNIQCDTKMFPDSHTFQDLVRRQQYRLIHLAGPIYDEHNPREPAGLSSVLCSDGPVPLLSLASNLLEQHRLVFLDTSHPQRQAGSSPEVARVHPFATLQTQLYEMMLSHVDDAELRHICFLLQPVGVNYEDLSSGGRRGKIQDLINYLMRHQNLKALLDVLDDERKDLRTRIAKLRDMLKAQPLPPERAIDLEEPMLKTPPQSTTGNAKLGESVIRSGASHCVTNMWNIGATSATRFAAQFYTYLMDGQMIGEAVRQARCDLRADTPENSAWAAYVLYGDPMVTMRPPR